MFTTSLQFNEQKFTIEQCPANVFDAFISQVAAKGIKNVDRQKWALHEKWRIINFCLVRGVLQLTTGPECQLLECVVEDDPVVEQSPEVEGEQVTA
jgi:hypothetical protein